MERPFCEVLAWDSEFFGRRIGRIVPIEAKGGRLDRALLAEVDAWCRAEEIDCLYFLADSGDPATAAVAEAGGFRLVDLRVTLEGPLTPVPSPTRTPPARERGATTREEKEEASLSFSPLSRAGGVRVGEGGQGGEGPLRLFRPEDVPELRRIAAASHHDSRFYADPHFDRERCDELYATWIEKSCRGEAADAVLVAEHNGKPAGYISCVRSGDTGEIGLIAVAAEAQGRGLGKTLIRASLRWFADRGLSRVRVVTQGRNVRAQRLYQAHGLYTRSIGLWFHRWEIP